MRGALRSLTQRYPRTVTVGTMVAVLGLLQLVGMAGATVLEGPPCSELGGAASEFQCKAASFNYCSGNGRYLRDLGSWF